MSVKKRKNEAGEYYSVVDREGKETGSKSTDYAEALRLNKRHAGNGDNVETDPQQNDKPPTYKEPSTYKKPKKTKLTPTGNSDLINYLKNNGSTARKKTL